MGNLISTSAILREKGIDLINRKIRLADIRDSAQANDLQLPPNCGGIGRVHHFRRFQGENWPEDPLPIDPATHYLNLPESDEITAEIFQCAICNFNCWYCFVDSNRINADPNNSKLLTVDEQIDQYLLLEERPPIVVLSGGQPDLVPEWILWFLNSIEERGLSKDIYVWSDDNLSCDFLFRYLSVTNIHRILKHRNYGRVGCFKGFNGYSFTFNTRADRGGFAQQFYNMGSIVKAGFDVYGYATFTSDRDANLARDISDFIDRIQSEIHPLFPLRTIPQRVFKFSPTGTRMNSRHYRALEIQNDVVQAWQEELVKRFDQKTRIKKIFEHKIN